MSFGVLKDSKIKLTPGDLHTSHTLGCEGNRDKVNRREVSE
jgi:hypothetical protein